jgi:O-antigen/teichoic acid export membrane protein
MARHDPDTEAIDEAAEEFPELRLSVGTTWYFVSRIVTLGTSFLIGIVVARTLGPVGKGELSVVMQVVSLSMVLLSLGIGSANVFFVSHRRTVPGVAAGNSVILAVVSAAAGLPLIVALLHSPIAVVPGVTWTTAILAVLLLPVTLLTGWLLGVIAGLGRIRLSVWLAFASSTLTLAGVALLWWRGMLSVQGVVAVSLLGSLAGLIVLAVGAWRSVAPLGVDSTAARATVSYSARIYAGDMAGYLVERQDMLLLGWLAGAGAVGLYSVGVSAAELVWFVPSALGPIIFAKAARTSVDSAADYVARSSRVSVLSMVVVSAVGVVLLPPVIGLLYGPAFATAAYAFYALLPGILCDGVGRVLASFLHSRNIILWRASVVSVVVNIALNIVLIPRWGIVGAGVASSICYGGLTIAALRAFGAETGVRSRAVLLPTTEDVRVVGRALGELPGRLLGRG